MKKCSVFIIHHGTENYPALYNNIATPILGGSQKDVGDFGERIATREDIGDTICEKHHLLSEFTIYYWVWKNTVLLQYPKYVGIFHYRTFLNLRDTACDGDFLTKMGITEENIKAQLQNYDAIITDVGKETWYSKDWKNAKLTIYKQYNNCHPLGEILFKKTIEFLKTGVGGIRVFYLFLPKIGDFVEGYFNSTSSKPYFKSVFVSTINYFKVYMKYLFTILDYLMEDEDVKKELDNLPKEKSYRLLAFFGERLTALFIAYCIKYGTFKIKEVERYHEKDLEKFLQKVYPPQIIKNRTVIPLIRFFSHTNKLYAYRPVNKISGTKDLPSATELTGQKFWVDRLEGYLLEKQEKGTMPVYMLQEPTGKDYFYTTDVDEYNRAKATSGYTRDFGCIGYIFTEDSSTDVTLPMVRYLFNAKDMTRHFYTPFINEAAEFGDLLGVEGVEEGVLGYILSSTPDKPILWSNRHDAEG